MPLSVAVCQLKIAAFLFRGHNTYLFVTIKRGQITLSWGP